MPRTPVLSKPVTGCASVITLRNTKPLMLRAPCFRTWRARRQTLLKPRPAGCSARSFLLATMSTNRSGYSPAVKKLGLHWRQSSCLVPMYCCSTNLRITSIPPVAQKYSMPSPTTRVRLFWSATIRVRSRRSIRNGCSSCPTAPKITGVRNTRSSSSSRNGAGRGKPNTRARQCLPCFQIERPCVETYRVCVAESSLYFELRAAVALLSPARGRVEHTVLVLRIDVHLLRAVSSDGAWVSRNSGWCVSLDQRRPLREISDGGTRWCGSAARAEHRATVHAHCSRGIPTVVVCVTQFKLGCALTVGCPPQPNEPHGREHEPLQGVGEVRSLVERGAGRGLRHGRCGTGGRCTSTSSEPARLTRHNRRGGVAACTIGLWNE